MNIYKRHRFSPDIISYAVWLYYRFNLSHRDIEDLLAERRIIVTRESIRLWYPKHSLRSWGSRSDLLLPRQLSPIFSTWEDIGCRPATIGISG